jgi:hypothetical protein
MYDQRIVGLIWSGYGTLAIIRDFAPATEGEQLQLEKTIRETRSAIERLVHDLVPIIEAALREGFTRKQVFDTITEKGEGLIPTRDLEVLISKVVGKLDEESRPAREAEEKAQFQALKDAIQKQIGDANAALRAMGLLR